MAKVLIDSATLVSIGNALREKLQSSEQFYPSEMADAISEIEQEVSITTNEVIGFDNYYFLSAEEYMNTDLTNFSTGDVLIITPVSLQQNIEE